MKLEEMLKTLELIYSPLEDTSLLLQNLANIKRKTHETIPEYRTRVTYRITTIGNFLRGPDKDVYSQIGKCNCTC